MVLAELTDPAAVTAAMDEFDRLGRDTFLRKYGFGRSRNYFVERDGALYDSKAIAGVAHGFEHPERGPLRAEDFSGGDATVRRKLEELGFAVQTERPEPSESFAEIVGRILELQGSYDSNNTPEMQLRGQLVRDEGRHAVRRLVAGLQGFSFEPSFEGRDGTGLKTRVPWIRVFDRTRSPRATVGWYVVYLFAADGSAVYASVNQGTTTFENGEFRRKDASFLQDRVEAARGLLGRPTDERLVQQITLHDPRGLGEGYEQGNVYAYRYDAGAVPADELLQEDLQGLLRMLDVIYQDEGLEDEPPQVGETGDGDVADEDAHVQAWEALRRETLWTDEALAEVLEALSATGRQIVLAGPPGTGKTRVARAIARYLADGDPNRWRLVQFHPSYGYEEFVEGLRPKSVGGTATFEVQPGVVKAMVEAMGGDRQPHVLVVDEMNRANLPRVLGELMFLLEYRDEPVDLQYSRAFRLPGNLLFIGTMNTADRSIRSIDVALRRRFEVFECPPDARILERFYDSVGTNRVAGLVSGFERLNEELQARLDKHHAIGHTFFMTPEMSPELLRRIWRRQIGPLIEEYFFDQPDVAAEFAPERFWQAL